MLEQLLLRRRLTKMFQTTTERFLHFHAYQKNRFGRPSIRSWEKACQLTPELFRQVGEKTAFRWKFPDTEAADRRGRPKGLDGAALKRLAEIVRSLSGRVALSSTVMIWVLQKDLDKMNLEYQLSVSWTEFMNTFGPQLQEEYSRRSMMQRKDCFV